MLFPIRPEAGNLQPFFFLIDGFLYLHNPRHTGGSPGHNLQSYWGNDVDIKLNQKCNRHTSTNTTHIRPEYYSVTTGGRPCKINSYTTKTWGLNSELVIKSYRTNSCQVSRSDKVCNVCLHWMFSWTQSDFEKYFNIFVSKEIWKHKDELYFNFRQMFANFWCVIISSGQR